MHASTYRFNSAIAVVVRDGSGPLFSELPPGSELVIADANPDHKGMIVGRYEGKEVLVFQRDLDERAEAIACSRVV